MNCNKNMKNRVPVQSCQAGCGYPAEYIQKNVPAAQAYELEQTYPLSQDNTAKPLLAMPELQYDTQNCQLYCEEPEALAGYDYTPGYLRDNIGNLMRVEFLIGNNTTERVGVLREVGMSYIVLDAVDCGGKMMCDLNSIKFVTTMQQANGMAMPYNFANI